MLAINKTGKAFTIGHLSFGPDDYNAAWDNHLFVHEYGHYIQSQILGPSYIKIIGIPSLISASKFGRKIIGIEHSNRWFEVNASRLGANYASKRDKNFDREKFVGPHPIHHNRHTLWDIIPPIIY